MNKSRINKNKPNPRWPGICAKFSNISQGVPSIECPKMGNTGLQARRQQRATSHGSRHRGFWMAFYQAVLVRMLYFAIKQLDGKSEYSNTLKY